MGNPLSAADFCFLEWPTAAGNGHFHGWNRGMRVEKLFSRIETRFLGVGDAFSLIE
jgi:hypothetical protein